MMMLYCAGCRVGGHGTMKSSEGSHRTATHSKFQISSKVVVAKSDLGEIRAYRCCSADGDGNFLRALFNGKIVLIPMFVSIIQKSYLPPICCLSRYLSIRTKSRFLLARTKLSPPSSSFVLTPTFIANQSTNPAAGPCQFNRQHE